MKKKETPSKEEIMSAIQSDKKFVNDLLVDNVKTRLYLKECFDESILPEIDEEMDREVYDLSQHLEETYSSLTGLYGHLIEMEVHYGREE
ncbi:hypothetical protein [uncultured Butyricimonas sp.]|uniref:hypothetical protein n=1 Tax=uncultured Butyricimonas sp. TaxID=1268785 RepID=UPI0026DDAE62|nr:hypothetical protein [uncultured Butyricimonas sp.]